MRSTATPAPKPEERLLLEAEGESMSQGNERPKTPLSEDWISVIIGLVLVIIVAAFSITSIPWPLFGVFA